MPIIIGGFSGGTGSRYQIVRTNYLIGRLYPNLTYNDNGATNFLTLMNQQLPNDLQADYLGLMFTGNTASFGDSNTISPNIIDLEGPDSSITGARFVPLIGPSFRSLAKAAGYTSYTDGVATTPPADSILRAHELMRKTNGIIQEVFSSALATIIVRQTASGTSVVYETKSLPLTADNLSPLEQSKFRLLITQFDSRADSASSLFEGGSLLDIGFFVKESGSNGVTFSGANRLGLDWDITGSTLTTNFIAKGNAQERVPTTLSDVFGNTGGIFSGEITTAGSGYAGNYKATLSYGSGGNGLQIYVVGDGAGGIGFISFLNEGGADNLDPGFGYSVGQVVDIPAGGGGSGAKFTVTGVQNRFGFLSLIALMDTHPPSQ